LKVTDKTNLSISKGDKKISSNICTAKLYLIVNVKNVKNLLFGTDSSLFGTDSSLFGTDSSLNLIFVLPCSVSYLNKKLLPLFIWTIIDVFNFYLIFFGRWVTLKLMMSTQ